LYLQFEQINILGFLSHRTIRLMRGFQHYVSVPALSYLRCPLQKYVRITFIRKNSVRTR